MDRNEAEAIIREALGEAASRFLKFLDLGLDPVEFVKAAVFKASQQFGVDRPADVQHTETGQRIIVPGTKIGLRVRRPRTSPPPLEQKCFEVKSTATDLLDPLQAAIFVSAGTVPSRAIRERFAETDRKAKRPELHVGRVIQQNESLRFSDIVRGIVRGASEQDEEAFASVKLKSAKNPSAGSINVFELHILQCLAMLKHQFNRPALSKPGCPYIIHRESSGVLGRGSVGLLENADQEIRPALQRWGLLSSLGRHAHDCTSTDEAIEAILSAFRGRRRSST